MDENGFQLKNGNVTFDPRLGRIPEFDERSRNFPIRALFTAEHEVPRSYRWKVPVWLDQGTQPSCVGFAWAQELAARPKMVEGITNEDGTRLYKLAQTLDEWAGENYPGSSTLGGVKACVAEGKILEYRWSFTTMDFAIATSWFGCGVSGINWYEGMYVPDSDGYIHVKGALKGGHEILVPGFNVNRNAFWLHNSWNINWGIAGGCWISFEDMDRLLHEQGDACIPTIRVK